MSEILRDASLGEFVALHCEDCGGRFRARSWREGIACPKCHSGQVRPLVAPGGAVDYCVADRSKGYAPADVRFAQWAKWCGLITPYQYEVAFIKQNRQIQEGLDPLPVHQVLIRDGALTERQAVRLLEFLSRPRPDEDDGRFVQTLLATGSVDAEKVRQTQALQLKAAAKYHELPPLGQLLMERHVITEAQMLAVFKLQQQSGYGALKVALDMAVGPAAQKRLPALREALSLRDPHTRKVALVAGLFLLGIGLWWRQAVASAPTMYVKCSRCNEISKVRAAKTFPVECPKCERKRAFFVKLCPNCRKQYPDRPAMYMFTVNNPYLPEPCPRCHSTSTRAVRAEDLP